MPFITFAHQIPHGAITPVILLFFLCASLLGSLAQLLFLVGFVFRILRIAALPVLAIGVMGSIKAAGL